MGVTAKESGQDFDREICPKGKHLARCYMVVDLGTQEEEYEGNKSLKRKVRLGWEFADLFIEYTDKNGNEVKYKRRISMELTNSLSEMSKLRPFLEDWRDKPFTADELNGFDISKLINVPCKLKIWHKTSKKGREYAIIKSAEKLSKEESVDAPDLTCEEVYFSFEDKPINELYVNELAEWLQNKIKDSLEWKTFVNKPVEKGTASIEETPEDKEINDIPF